MASDAALPGVSVGGGAAAPPLPTLAARGAPTAVRERTQARHAPAAVPTVVAEAGPAAALPVKRERDAEVPADEEAARAQQLRRVEHAPADGGVAIGNVLAGVLAARYNVQNLSDAEEEDLPDSLKLLPQQEALLRLLGALSSALHKEDTGGGAALPGPPAAHQPGRLALVLEGAPPPAADGTDIQSAAGVADPRLASARHAPSSVTLMRAQSLPAHDKFIGCVGGLQACTRNEGIYRAAYTAAVAAAAGAAGLGMAAPPACTSCCLPDQSCGGRGSGSGSGTGSDASMQRTASDRGGNGSGSGSAAFTRNSGPEGDAGDLLSGCAGGGGKLLYSGLLAEVAAAAAAAAAAVVAQEGDGTDVAGASFERASRSPTRDRRAPQPQPQAGAAAGATGGGQEHARNAIPVQPVREPVKCPPQPEPVLSQLGAALPPELQARLKKKIRIIQPISCTWVSDALRPAAIEGSVAQPSCGTLRSDARLTTAATEDAGTTPTLPPPPPPPQGAASAPSSAAAAAAELPARAPRKRPGAPQDAPAEMPPATRASAPQDASGAGGRGGATRRPSPGPHAAEPPAGRPAGGPASRRGGASPAQQQQRAAASAASLVAVEGGGGGAAAPAQQQQPTSSLQPAHLLPPPPKQGAAAGKGAPVEAALPLATQLRPPRTLSGLSGLFDLPPLLPSAAALALLPRNGASGTSSDTPTPALATSLRSAAAAPSAAAASSGLLAALLSGSAALSTAPGAAAAAATTTDRTDGHSALSVRAASLPLASRASLTPPSGAEPARLERVRGELTLLYQWYAANKAVYLDAATRQLQRVERLTAVVEAQEAAASAAAAMEAEGAAAGGAGAASSAPLPPPLAAPARRRGGGARGESSEAMRAFETALHIMTVCSSVEQQCLGPRQAPPLAAASGQPGGALLWPGGGGGGGWGGGSPEAALAVAAALVGSAAQHRAALQQKGGAGAAPAAASAGAARGGLPAACRLAPLLGGGGAASGVALGPAAADAAAAGGGGDGGVARALPAAPLGALAWPPAAAPVAPPALPVSPRNPPASA